jgi:hypothetical protein
VKTAASIGIALYPQDGANAQALMKNADTAMYHAKQNSATPVQFFHEELNVRERERERWTLELRKALASGQLELRYEPQVDLDTGRMIAAEAAVLAPSGAWRDGGRAVPAAGAGARACWTASTPGDDVLLAGRAVARPAGGTRAQHRQRRRCASGSIWPRRSCSPTCCKRCCRPCASMAGGRQHRHRTQ